MTTDTIATDPLADIPMIFTAGPGGAPLYPVFTTPDAVPKFDRVFSIGPATLRSLGRSMMDIRHELIMRGYFIEKCAVLHKSPLIVVANGIDSPSHECRMRIQFRGAMNPAEEQLLFHELGVISAAHQWAHEHAARAESEIILPDA
jgi:hypothetical protein